MSDRTNIPVDILNELLAKLAEEGAEIIQAVTKSQRFGICNIYKGMSNRQNIEVEIGNLLAVVELLEAYGMVNIDNILCHAYAHHDRMRKNLRAAMNVEEHAANNQRSFNVVSDDD